MFGAAWANVSFSICLGQRSLNELLQKSLISLSMIFRQISVISVLVRILTAVSVSLSWSSLGGLWSVIDQWVNGQSFRDHWYDLSKISGSMPDVNFQVISQIWIWYWSLSKLSAVFKVLRGSCWKSCFCNHSICLSAGFPWRSLFHRDSKFHGIIGDCMD